MLLLTDIYTWQDRRDSSSKIPTLDKNKVGYRTFLINPNRISDMKDLSNIAVTRSSFLFSENHRDRRENNSYIVCGHSPAQIEAVHNTAFASQFITLPFYPKNNPNKTAVDTTIDVDDIAYFDAYNPDPDNYCWLIYDRKAFRRVEQLVGLSLEQVEDIAETGTTTTTSSTTDQR